MLPTHECQILYQNEALTILNPAIIASRKAELHDHYRYMTDPL